MPKSKLKSGGKHRGKSHSYTAGGTVSDIPAFKHGGGHPKSTRPTLKAKEKPDKNAPDKYDKAVGPRHQRDRHVFLSSLSYDPKHKPLKITVVNKKDGTIDIPKTIKLDKNNKAIAAFAALESTHGGEVLSRTIEALNLKKYPSHIIRAARKVSRGEP